MIALRKKIQVKNKITRLRGEQLNLQNKRDIILNLSAETKEKYLLQLEESKLNYDQMNRNQVRLEENKTKLANRIKEFEKQSATASKSNWRMNLRKFTTNIKNALEKQNKVLNKIFVEKQNFKVNNSNRNYLSQLINQKYTSMKKNSEIIVKFQEEIKLTEAKKELNEKSLAESHQQNHSNQGRKINEIHNAKFNNKLNII